MAGAEGRQAMTRRISPAVTLGLVMALVAILVTVGVILAAAIS